MADSLKLAVAGVGNNISALLQGVYYYRRLLTESPSATLPGVRCPHIGGLGVTSFQIVAAFDVQQEKIGVDISDAIFVWPNNYLDLHVAVPKQDVLVDRGLVRNGSTVAGVDAVVDKLRASEAEVLLYSLPTGMQWAATAYAEAACAARVAFVNCTPEHVARDPLMMTRFVDAGIPLIGDDLASHLGTSVVHRSLLNLLTERGLTLDSSYQLNLGGNEDFRNLREQGASKRESKLNALRSEGISVENVEVIPSAGYVPHLRDNKIAYLNIEGSGWAGTPVSLEVRLKVQDSSNAAGVVVDLIRVAAAARRAGWGGFIPAAAPQLKSPAGGHVAHPAEAVNASYETLSATSDDVGTAASSGGTR